MVLFKKQGKGGCTLQNTFTRYRTTIFPKIFMVKPTLRHKIPQFRALKKLPSLRKLGLILTQNTGWERLIFSLFHCGRSSVFTLPSGAPGNIQRLGYSSQKRFIHRCSTQHAMQPGSAGNRHVTPLAVEVYGTGHTVLSGAVHSHVPARPAAVQNFSYQWGAAGWGEQYKFMFHFSDLMTPPPRRPH